MKVAILGSGVIGVSSAYYLARAGAAVTVIDRQSAAGLETSFANAGQVSAGYSTPWAAPGIPAKAVKWLLFDKHAPLAIRPDWERPALQLRWMYNMWRNCSARSYERNKERMMRLSEYSRDCLRTIRTEVGLEYESRSLGTLQLFRHTEQLDSAAKKDVKVLEQCGVSYELLDRDGCARVEPALAHVSDVYVGGLRLPNDETGDCFLYTQRLAKHCAEKLGVAFRFGQEVQALDVAGPRIRRALLSDGSAIDADVFLVALGSYSTQFLRPLRINIPVYPLKGYSLTIPFDEADSAFAPVSTILDETYKIALTRFDSRIRVGGMAEIAGFDTTLRPEPRRTLQKVTTDLFPRACKNIDQAQFWTGFRPMTPDSTPIVGPVSSVDNLFLSTGHGTLGWTMGSGSGKLIADLILQRPTDIKTDGLFLDRYLVE